MKTLLMTLFAALALSMGALNACPCEETPATTKAEAKPEPKAVAKTDTAKTAVAQEGSCCPEEAGCCPVAAAAKVERVKAAKAAVKAASDSVASVVAAVIPSANVSNATACAGACGNGCGGGECQGCGTCKEAAAKAASAKSSEGCDSCKTAEAKPAEKTAESKKVAN